VRGLIENLATTHGTQSRYWSNPLDVFSAERGIVLHPNNS
jgi:hypothetical protein